MSDKQPVINIAPLIMVEYDSSAKKTVKRLSTNDFEAIEADLRGSKNSRLQNQKVSDLNESSSS